MKKPVHPGRIVRHDCLELLASLLPEAAKALDSTPDIWVKMQAAF